MVAQPPPDSQPPGPETAPCSACPLAPRLEHAKQVYRAQQATLAQLEDRLGRYQRLGLRRWQQPTAAQALYGTLVWSENVLLRRENARNRETIAQQRTTIRHLHALAEVVGTPQTEDA
jgi:hypothetical protein